MRTPLWLGEGNTGKPRVQPGFRRVPTETPGSQRLAGAIMSEPPAARHIRLVFASLDAAITCEYDDAFP